MVIENIHIEREFIVFYTLSANKKGPCHENKILQAYIHLILISVTISSIISFIWRSRVPGI